MSRWLSLSLVLMLPAAALAADDPKKDTLDRERLLKATPEEFIKAFDKNNEGKLVADELPPMIARAFEKADRNGDGKLDAKEVEEMLNVLRERFGNANPPAAKPDLDKAVTGILERFDVNKDGKISKGEAKGPLAANFARIDRNGDGYLDKEELKPAAERLAAAGGQPGRPNLERVVADILERLDANKDGKISKDEAKNAPIAEAFARLDKNND